MTQEWMLRTLIHLRIKRQDAQVYVFLAFRGANKAKDIAYGLKVDKKQVYQSLDRLKQKNFIFETPKVPAQLMAVSFEKVLDVLMAASLEGVKDLESKKAGIIKSWKANL